MWYFRQICIAHCCGKILNSISLKKEWFTLAQRGLWWEARKSGTRHKSNLSKATSSDLLCHPDSSSTAFKMVPEAGDQVFRTWACGEHSRFNNDNMKLVVCTSEPSHWLKEHNVEPLAKPVLASTSAPLQDTVIFGIGCLLLPWVSVPKQNIMIFRKKESFSTGNVLSLSQMPEVHCHRARYMLHIQWMLDICYSNWSGHMPTSGI